MINDNNVKEQDLEDMAFALILGAEQYLPGEPSGLEVAGAVHTIISTAILEIYKPHGNEITEGSTEGSQDGSSRESIEGVAVGPEQVQGSGSQGRLEEGQEGVREADEATADGDSKTERPSES